MQPLEVWPGISLLPLSLDVLHGGIILMGGYMESDLAAADNSEGDPAGSYVQNPNI